MYIKIPSGVNKLCCTYLEDNIFILDKSNEVYYDYVDEQINNIKHKTRNIWPVSTDVDVTSSYLIGTSGVSLLPANTYTLSFELSNNTPSHSVTMTIYPENIQIFKMATYASRFTTTINCTLDIERIFIYYDNYKEQPTG